MFRSLYASHIKPKFHHMMHLTENMSYVGACLGCFVTERKHRTIKGAACHIFRHFEHTVLVDLVNRQVEDFRQGRGLEGLDLVSPKPLEISGRTLLVATSCLLPCGEVFVDDVVALSQSRLGKVCKFWADKELRLEGLVDRSSTIAIEIVLYHCASQDKTTWSTEGRHTPSSWPRR